MKKSKFFRDTKFKPEVIRSASSSLQNFYEGEKSPYAYVRLIINNFGNVSWEHDSIEEFFSDYRKDHKNSSYRNSISVDYSLYLYFNNQDRGSDLAVEAPSRHEIETIFDIFESSVEYCKLPPLPTLPKENYQIKPKIFIGHGGSFQWKELKDHLHEKHGYEIEAYEVGSRAGHAVRDILEDMLDKSSFAILVMTGEDKDEHGNLRARQNVIHELGLFQGRLGFSRAIVLLEDGTEEFSNIQGIHQIRYGKANIKETFGEVLATLKREFE